MQGQRLDLANRRQIIDLEIAEPERVPEGALQILAIPVDKQEHAVPGWLPGDEISGVTHTTKPRSLRVIVDTPQISPAIDALIVVVHAEKPGVMRFKLDRAGNIFVRVNTELFDLTEHAHGRAVAAFSIYRRGPLWRFRAIGEPYEWGLEELYPRYGIAPGLAPHTRTQP